jgi:hypothetical protein
MQNFHVKIIIHHDNAFVMHSWWAGFAQFYILFSLNFQSKSVILGVNMTETIKNK